MTPPSISVRRWLVASMLLHVTLLCHHSAGEERPSSVESSVRRTAERSASKSLKTTDPTVEAHRPQCVGSGISKRSEQASPAEPSRNGSATSNESLVWYVDLLLLVEHNGSDYHSLLTQVHREAATGLVPYFDQIKVPEIKIRLLGPLAVHSDELVVSMTYGLNYDPYIYYNNSIRSLFQTLRNRSVPQYDAAILLTKQHISSYRDTIGMAMQGEACTDADNIIMVERIDIQQRNWTDTGAHELGHLMDLYHDGVNNTCDTYLYLMSPYSYDINTRTWSNCSLDRLREVALEERFPCFLH